MAKISLNTAIMQLLGRNPEPADYANEELMDAVAELMKKSEGDMGATTFIEGKTATVNQVKEGFAKINAEKKTEGKPPVV